MRRLIAYASGMMLLFVFLTAQASSSNLTDAQVRNFIASMPDVEVLGEQYPEIDDGLDEDDDEIDFTNPISSGIAKMRGQEAYKSLSQIVKRHGFSSPEQWGQVGDRVVRAMMALSMDEDYSSARAEMAEAMKQIDDNPSLSPEQRAELKRMMSGGMSMMESASEAPAADIKAVQPHMAELQRAMGGDD